jgi:hypothetical protein
VALWYQGHVVHVVHTRASSWSSDRSLFARINYAVLRTRGKSISAKPLLDCCLPDSFRDMHCIGLSLQVLTVSRLVLRNK